MKKMKYKWDILILLAIVSTAVVLGCFLLLGSKKGARVMLEVDGNAVASYSLNQDATYEIVGVDEGINVLVIRDGMAWMSEASCPDKLCVKMGRIGRAGQSIVCLPNKVVVKIAEEGEDPDVDLYAS